MTDNSEYPDSFGVGIQSTKVPNSYGSDLEISALKQMAYDSNFAEDINMKMRIPQKLTVASRHEEEDTQYSNTYGNVQNNGNAAYNMEVPDRIIVSVGDSGVKYGGSQQTHEPWNTEELSQNPTDILSLTTPPRKLTLAERNLDALDIHDAQNDSNSSEGSSDVKPHDSLSGDVESGTDAILKKNIKPKSSAMASIIAPIHNSIMDNIHETTQHFYHSLLGVLDETTGANQNRFRNSISLQEANTSAIRNSDVTNKKSNILMERIVPKVQQNDSMEELDDVSSLRRQVFKLHRRITAIEKQHAEKSKRDSYFYAVTVAFWVINGWFLYSLRKPY